MFRLHGQPFLFLSCGQGRHYHTAKDTPEWLNFEKLAHVTAFLERVVRRVDGRTQAAGGEVDTAQMDTAQIDTAQFELRMLEKALGLPRAEMARLLGLPRLETREDLNVVAQALSSALAVWEH